MNSTLLLGIIGGYFCLLLAVSHFTSKNATTDTFFTGNRSSPWYLVAFGMIGTSLSGVTFLSIPGWVNTESFGYFQIVLGYLVGYVIIATILMPMYYKMGFTSIYTYLKHRFGYWTYKTGAGFFLLSRTIGASLRLFLVAGVLQYIIFDNLGIPFLVTVAITILLIYVYTFRGGIKTIVWTDTLQTFCMLLAVIFTIVSISNQLGISNLFDTVTQSNYSKMFFFDNWQAKNFFPKQFLSGVFISVAMTGLDQDMMQKNLSCKSIQEAQKNMFSFSIVLVFVNLLFLSLGALLYSYASQYNIKIPSRTDYLFPEIVVNHLGTATSIMFFIGLIAAAYSSADSALTSLTTSFCVDILNIDPALSTKENKKKRMTVHVLFSVVLFIMILWANTWKDDAIINKLFTYASYTYGPLLGLYTFGLFTNRKVNDLFIPLICIIAPVITYGVQFIVTKHSEFEFSYTTLLINAGFTFAGLMLCPKESI